MIEANEKIIFTGQEKRQICEVLIIEGQVRVRIRAIEVKKIPILYYPSLLGASPFTSLLLVC